MSPRAILAYGMPLAILAGITAGLLFPSSPVVAGSPVRVVVTTVPATTTTRATLSPLTIRAPSSSTTRTTTTDTGIEYPSSTVPVVTMSPARVRYLAVVKACTKQFGMELMASDPDWITCFEGYGIEP
jgi:hypothetical protein